MQRLRDRTLLLGDLFSCFQTPQNTVIVWSLGFRQPCHKQYIVPSDVESECCKGIGEDCGIGDTGHHESPHKKERISHGIGGTAMARTISSVCIVVDIEAANSCVCLLHCVAA